MSDKPTSLREQIEAAYESVESTDDTNEITVESEDTDTATSDKTHDVPSEDEEVDSTQNIESAPDDSNGVPSNWSSEDREAFLELDEKSRKLYLKRYKEMEGGYTKKSQTLAEERKIAENFKKAIGQHEAYINSLGLDPYSTVDKLLSTERLFRTGTPQQKADALKRLMNDYQLQLYNEASSQSIEQNTPIDPNLQALWEEQAKTRQYLSNMQAEKQYQEEQGVLNQINAFSSAKDEAGQLKYPHFEEVRQDMGKALNSGFAKNLEKAYELAVLANEDLRKEYVLRQTNESKRLEDVKKRTSAAKQAGFNVKTSGSSPAGIEPAQKLSRREIIEKEYESQQRRGRI